LQGCRDEWLRIRETIGKVNWKKTRRQTKQLIMTTTNSDNVWEGLFTCSSASRENQAVGARGIFWISQSIELLAAMEVHRLPLIRHSTVRPFVRRSRHKSYATSTIHKIDRRCISHPRNFSAASFVLPSKLSSKNNKKMLLIRSCREKTQGYPV
jgi:hypothetical protein